MSDEATYLQRLATTVVYLHNAYEEAVIKSMPDGTCFVKIKGKPEFKAHPDSMLVADAKVAPEEITKAQYEAFT